MSQSTSCGMQREAGGMPKISCRCFPFPSAKKTLHSRSAVCQALQYVVKPSMNGHPGLKVLSVEVDRQSDDYPVMFLAHV